MSEHAINVPSLRFVNLERAQKQYRNSDRRHKECIKPRLRMAVMAVPSAVVDTFFMRATANLPTS
jgi:hypothetical protein